MSAVFYLSKGLKFWECYHALETVCALDVSPVGAPLGEEVTRRADFKEASCKVSVRFPELNEPVFGGIDFRSMPDLDPDSALNLRWNPEGDSLIHRISIGFSDVSLTPERFHEWPDRMGAALAIYHLYKRMFVVSGCDEATGMSGKYPCTVFKWDRWAEQQAVIHTYEENRVLTLEEFGQQHWCGPKKTALVFPELVK